MIKGKVQTIGETLRKAEGKPKMTKDEMQKWINFRIRRRAREEIKNPDKCKKSPTLDKVADCIYESFVEDWAYNEQILQASRSVGLSKSYIISLIADLFDKDGKPFSIEDLGTDGAKTPEREAYHASIVSIDEVYEELAKAKAKDAEIQKKQKSKRNRLVD